MESKRITATFPNEEARLNVERFIRCMMVMQKHECPKGKEATAELLAAIAAGMVERADMSRRIGELEAVIIDEVLSDGE